MLVQKMRDAADKQGQEVQIDAFAANEFDDQVQNFDIVLVGPQVKYMLNDFKGRAAPYNIPVEVISAIDYGTMNGAKVLQFALSLNS